MAIQREHIPRFNYLSSLKYQNISSYIPGQDMDEGRDEDYDSKLLLCVYRPEPVNYPQ